MMIVRLQVPCQEKCSSGGSDQAIESRPRDMAAVHPSASSKLFFSASFCGSARNAFRRSPEVDHLSL
jgi:hypothetical protein